MASDSFVAYKKRIDWIDMAKGLAILTVIWGHTLENGSLARMVIYAFHMPLLFLVSGYTLKAAVNWQDFLDRTKKDFIRLIVPVLFIVAIEAILRILLDGSSFSDQLSSSLYRLFWASGLSRVEGMPSLGMPWFMVALFFAKMLVRLMSFRIKDYKIVGFFLGFVGIILGTRGAWLPLGLDVVLVAVMFVSSGMIAKDYHSIIVRYKVPLFIASMLFIYSVLTTCGWVDFAGHNYNLLSVIEGFAASYIVCVLCNAVSSLTILRKVLCLIGASTMPIFITHSLDGFFSFLYAHDNMYIECIFRTFYVLLYAWAFTYIFRMIRALFRYMRNSRKI